MPLDRDQEQEIGIGPYSGPEVYGELAAGKSAEQISYDNLLHDWADMNDKIAEIVRRIDATPAASAGALREIRNELAALLPPSLLANNASPYTP